MPVALDLTGRWVGFYSQHDEERPITVEIDQAGDRIRGTMRDGRTAFRMPLSELAMFEGLPPGADERITESLRNAYPDAPPEPIEAEVQLPPLSTVEGEVDPKGRAIRFLKTYQGTLFAGYRIGEVRLGVLGADQEVQFQGRLSPDGHEIEGHWRLPGPPHPLWLATTEGGFFLRRDADDLDFDLID
jgi:hypothetical protein